MKNKVIGFFLCLIILMSFTASAKVNIISKGQGNNLIVDLLIINFYAGPDLETEGNLNWANVEPSTKVTGTFIVKNVGDSGSELDWKIMEHPPWGSWTFNPLSGENLKPEDEKVSVGVTVTAPIEKGKFEGRIKVINKNNPQDYKFVLVSLSSSKNKETSSFNPNFMNNNSLLLLLLKIVRE